MPLDLSELRANRVKLDLPKFPAVNVYHTPSSYTAAFEAKAREAAETPSSEFLCQTLPELICEWDVTDNGQPVAITPENLRNIPLEFLVAISQGISKAHTPFDQTETQESTAVSS